MSVQFGIRYLSVISLNSCAIHGNRFSDRYSAAVHNGMNVCTRLVSFQRNWHRWWQPKLLLHREFHENQRTENHISLRAPVTFTFVLSDLSEIRHNRSANNAVLRRSSGAEGGGGRAGAPGSRLQGATK